MEILTLSIEAAFQTRLEKVSTLKRLRIKNGVLQNLIRNENELKIIDDKTYERLSKQIIEISKETNSWLASLTPKEP